MGGMPVMSGAVTGERFVLQRLLRRVRKLVARVDMLREERGRV